MAMCITTYNTYITAITIKQNSQCICICVLNYLKNVLITRRSVMILYIMYLFHHSLHTKKQMQASCGKDLLLLFVLTFVCVQVFIQTYLFISLSCCYRHINDILFCSQHFLTVRFEHLSHNSQPVLICSYIVQLRQRTLDSVLLYN